MSEQDAREPPYPATREECDAYCGRLVAALRKHFRDRLVGVLLSGSWARGEARPGSDVDLTVVVDTVDDDLLARLRPAWIDAGVGYANVYGRDEIPAMSREALEMYTVNARVLHGENPFPPPTRDDFARDLATTTEVVARLARNLVIAHWMTREEVADNVEFLLGKTCLERALRILTALRTGRFPARWEEVRAALADSPEGGLLGWLDDLDADGRVARTAEIARRVNRLARALYRESLR